MTNTEIIAVIALTAFGLIFGVLTARGSNRRDPIHSGPPGQVLHYLACSVVSAITPTILVSLFVLHVGFIRAVLIAVLMFAAALLLLMGYAAVERPAKQAYEREQANKGWTEADARASGL